MRVETRALVMLKKRLRNIRILTRIAEGLMPPGVWGCATAVPLDCATSWARSETV
jgi:hypothetical protein